MPRQPASDAVAAPKRRAVKSLKDRIVHIVRSSSKMMGAPAIKKKLMEEFGMEKTKAFDANVKKALEDLVDEEDERQDFGVCGRLYHGGCSSVAYLAQLTDEEKAVQFEKFREEGRIQCIHCNEWTLNEFIREDYVARGGELRCLGCHKTYWTWISDLYTVAHDVEYRFGPGRKEYMEILGDDFNTPY